MTQKRRKLGVEQLINEVHTYCINYQTRELYLHGFYDESEPGVDYRMATTFVKNVHILDQQGNENILVHMHTIGGEWADGMAAFNTIRLAKSPVTILAHAQASSMSGIILQAADKRVLMPDCEMMIHHGSIGVYDNSIAVKSAIESNERTRKRMLTIFAQRAINGQYFKERDYDVKKIAIYLDSKLRQKSDWYLPADEALYYGFCDGVFGEKGYETLEKIRINRKIKDETH